MDVVNDDAKVDFRRIEVLTGPGRRRRWSAEEKGRIVAETLQAGATVTEVARRWQVCPQQLWGWRREAGAGLLALPMEAACPPAAASFVPIVTEAPPAIADAVPGEPNVERVGKPLSPPVIEIRLAGAVVRVMAGTDGALLTTVLRAVRTSAA